MDESAGSKVYIFIANDPAPAQASRHLSLPRQNMRANIIERASSPTKPIQTSKKGGKGFADHDLMIFPKLGY